MLCGSSLSSVVVGAELRFVNSRPTVEGGGAPQAQAAVLIMGGPKGITPPIKEEPKHLIGILFHFAFYFKCM